MTALCELKPGAIGRVVTESRNLSDRFLEMGLLPGALVQVLRVAPLGDPIALRIQNTQVAIRRADAAHIVVDVG